MGLCAPRFASPRCVCGHTHSTEEGMRASSLSRVRLLVTPWTVAHQAPLSREFSRLEYWSGFAHSICHFFPPGDRPNPGVEPASPAALVGRFFTTEPPGKPEEDGLLYLEAFEILSSPAC